MPAAIATVENWQTSALGIAAATLLVTEVPSLKFMDVQQYLATCDPARDAMYASLETGDTLLAAAVVTHNAISRTLGETRTFIGALAVSPSPEHRKRGHCRDLMQHIARQAVLRGDSMIAHGPASPAFRVIDAKMGFRKLNPDNDKEMEATPADVLSYKHWA